MSAAEPLRKISEEEIADFHRDGAVLLKGVLPDQWNEVLEAGLEYAHAHPDGMSAGVDMPLRIDQFPASHSDDLRRLLRESPIAGIVGSALDAPVRFYMDQIVLQARPASSAQRRGIRTPATTTSAATS